MRAFHIAARRYVGDYVDARRHGKGTFTDDMSCLLSLFASGNPKHEGTKLLTDSKSDKLSTAFRTHDGNADGEISMTEAEAIASNVGLGVPRTLASAASLSSTPPPAASKARSRLPSVPDDDGGSLDWVYPRWDKETGMWLEEPPRSAPAEQNDFLSRLAAAEGRDTERAQVSSPPSIAKQRKQQEMAGANSRLGRKPSPPAAGRKPKKSRAAETLPAQA